MNGNHPIKPVSGLDDADWTWSNCAGPPICRGVLNGQERMGGALEDSRHKSCLPRSKDDLHGWEEVLP